MAKNKTSVVLHDATIARLELDDVAAAITRIHNCDLRGARLNNVDLRNVKITDANIEGLTIDGVRIDKLLAKA